MSEYPIRNQSLIKILVFININEIYLQIQPSKVHPETGYLFYLSVYIDNNVKQQLFSI